MRKNTNGSLGLSCPTCGVVTVTRVVDCETLKEGHKKRRRRECVKCLTRYTTFEFMAA